MISVLRGLMASDSGANRPLPSLILLGIVDFVCILMAAESYRDKQSRAAIIWLAAGLVSSLIGYYWPQLKQKVFSDAPLQSLPSASASVPVVTHPETKAQGDQREMVNVTPEYLTGFYRQGHTSVQAKKLAEAFIGKWMKVSGPLGDVLGNYDNQRMVVFSDRSISTNDFVNMFFSDKERFGRLSTLKLGDTITVVGQVTEVNSLEIWLHNCELVDS